MKHNYTGLPLARILMHVVWIVMVWPVGAQNFRFERQTIKEGLSQNTINCMLQDKKGFIWFGTQDGLNCWDGYTFTVYRNDPNDSTSLSHSYVRSLHEDSKGRLWVGTMWGFNLFNSRLRNFERYHCGLKDRVPDQVGYSNSIRAIAQTNSGLLAIGTFGDGLCFFNPETKTFEVYVNDPDNPASLADNRVCSILAERDGKIWVGTEDGGLELLDFKTKTFEHFKNDPQNSSSISNNRVYSIYRDRSNRLWVGTFGGLNLFDSQTKTFERFEHSPDRPFSLSNNTVYSILEDQKGRLWVGTFDGLNLLYPTKKTFRVLRNKPGDVTSLSDNSVHSIYENKAGQLLVGTYHGGVNLLNGRAEQFITFSHDPSNPTTLSNNMVWAIHEDRNGRLWVGTDKGLNLYNALNNSFEHQTQNKPSWLPGYAILSLAEDKSGRLWVGTSNDGLLILNVKSKSTEHYKSIPGNSSSLPSNRVTSFYEDSTGNMWVGSNGGLSAFDPLTKTFKNYRNDPDESRPLDHNVLNAIREDSKGRLWLGTNGGLSLFDTQTKTFTNYQQDRNDITTISSNNAYSVLEDRSGRWWIGTESGLNLFDTNTQSFRALHYEREFPKDVFYSVLEDNRGRLWSSTNSGLLRFTPASDFAPEKGIWGEIKAYTIDDGIPNNEFSLGSQFRGKDGRMYFGTGNGFMVFHPDSLKDNLDPPPVFLTDLEIFNKPIIPGKEYNGFVLPVSITETAELVLSHRESVFTLRFSALSFANAAKNKYAYQLQGFDKDWNYTDAQQRLATYTNLDPGTYSFRVKGSNRDGIWNETGATLKIVITPPWWGTWWFRTILAFSSLGALILVFVVRTQSIRNTNKLLTETVEQKTKELKEKNQVLVEQEREILTQNEELLAQTTVLEEKNQELERAKGLLEIELQYQYQRELLKMSIDVQENERKRIAQDLHDELGAVLSIARMQLVQMQNNIATPALSKGLQQAQAMTETALATMRRISHELMPPQLEKYGLIKTLEALAGQINSTKKVSINLTTPDGTPRWIMPVELGLYRIAMEMINNTLRHAEAGYIHIQLIQTLKNVVFSYSDDGKGLPKNYIEGHGFKNIEARTNALGGTIEIGKEGATGFNATIYIPQIFFEHKTSATRISSEDHAK